MTDERRLIARWLLLWIAACPAVVAGQAPAPATVPGPDAVVQGGGTTTAAAGQPTAEPAVNASPNYVIGANDRLRITVWNQPNVSGDYAVSGDGSFTFPLIGRVVVGGLTLAAIESELKEMLAAGFFRNPQVTVAVLDYRSKQVFVLGALRNPGAYPILGEISLTEALARAGSTANDAADHALIIRPRTAQQGPVLPGQDDGATMIRVDLRQLNEGQLPSDVSVRDGDTVFVPRVSSIYVYGQVKSPGAFPVGQSTTVRQALSLAGGAAEFGAVNRVKILRFENGQRREIKVELDDLVKAGDTIVVPERFF